MVQSIDDESMAQGRLSVESVGRLVEREREASLLFPKKGDAHPHRASWHADLRFTAPDTADPCMDRGKIRPRSISICDSLADAAFTMELGECDVGDTGAGGSYTESPFCYSFCAWEDDSLATGSDALHQTGASDSAVTSANRRAQDDDNVVAPRRVLLAQEGHHVTPTNIEDAIGKFREGGDGGDPAFVAEKEALFPARAKALQHDLSAYYKQRRGTQNLRKSSP